MKSDEDRGPFGSWLRRERTSREWKEAETRRRLEAAKPGVSFSSYRDIEAGNRKPTEDQREAIEAVFGRIPNFTSTSSTDLASAIMALTEELRERRLERERTEARMAYLEAAVAILARAAAVELPTQYVPDGKAG